MKTKPSRDWECITSDLEVMCSMSCKPTQARLRPDYVIDEDKSVKWNREEVQRLNDLHDQQVIELNRKKNKMRDELYKEIEAKVAEELGLKPEQVHPIWYRAYEQSHSYGIREVMNTLQDLIDLFDQVLTGGEN